MCYNVPAAGAIITTVIWSKTKNAKVGWLNLLLWGGAIFGVVDHIWNGELFLISENIVSDLLLGAVITAALVACWGVTVIMSKRDPVPADPVKSRTE